MSAVLMIAFKSSCRELSIKYFSLPIMGGVCEISSKEREGPSSLRLKAPHTTYTYMILGTIAIIVERPGSVHDAEL